MPFLEIEFLNNSLQNWLLAVATAVFVILLVWVVRRVVVQRVQTLAQQTRTDVDDMLLQLADRVPRWIITLLAIFAGSRWLNFPETAVPWINAAAIIIILIQVGIWGSAAINWWLVKNQQTDTIGEASQATTLRAVSFVLKLVLYSILLLLALDNLPGVEITTLIASLGIGGIAIALAVQNILGDLFASLSISLDKPFVLGDFIVVGDIKGTVEEIGLKTTRLRSLWGERLVVSNSDLLSSRIQNFRDMQERRVVFSFGITYNTPVEKVRQVSEMVKTIITNLDQTRFDRAHFNAFGNSALNYEVVYYVLSPDFNIYMDIQQEINLSLLTYFRENEIEFAYPTQTIYLAGAGGPAAKNGQTAVLASDKNGTNQPTR